MNKIIILLQKIFRTSGSMDRPEDYRLGRLWDAGWTACNEGHKQSSASFLIGDEKSAWLAGWRASENMFMICW